MHSPMLRPFSNFNFKGLIYRLPFYIFLPTSIISYWIDYSLYVSSAGDLSNYTDCTIRLGMTPGFQIIIIAIFIGSLMLFAASIALVTQSVQEKRFLLGNTAFILLGIISHPWFVGMFFNYDFQ